MCCSLVVLELTNLHGRQEVANAKSRWHYMYHVMLGNSRRKYFLFDLIVYVPSTIFQLHRDGSSMVEPVLS